MQSSVEVGVSSPAQQEMQQPIEVGDSSCGVPQRNRRKKLGVSHPLAGDVTSSQSWKCTDGSPEVRHPRRLEVRRRLSRRCNTRSKLEIRRRLVRRYNRQWKSGATSTAWLEDIKSD